MPFTVLTKPVVGDPTKKSLADGQIDDLNYLESQLALANSGIGILNGSFEIGSGADTAPAAWDLSIASGNHTAFETSAGNTRHGAQAFSMTNSTGASGGVTLTTKDFIPWAVDQNLRLYWLMKSSLATVTNTVQVKWYTEAEVFISTSTVYNVTTGNPTVWSPFSYSVAPPAGAKFYKAIFIGVNSATNGTTYWDGIFVSVVDVPKIAVLTANGTYTCTSTQIQVELLGDGIAGGSGSVNDGASGGASGDFIKTILAVNPTEILTFTRGNPSTLAGSFGTLNTSTTAGSATIFKSQNPGQGGASGGSNYGGTGGNGGSSPYGQGGQGGMGGILSALPNGAYGQDGVGYGAGGGGGGGQGTGGPGGGGNPSTGLCIITAM